jgi:hypothetical protein
LICIYVFGIPVFQSRLFYDLGLVWLKELELSSLGLNCLNVTLFVWKGVNTNPDKVMWLKLNPFSFLAYIGVSIVEGLNLVLEYKLVSYIELVRYIY